MFDDHERQPLLPHRGVDRGPHDGRIGRGQHRGRFVEKQHRRLQRKGAGEGQPLRLAAGERIGRSRQGQVEPDLRERGGDEFGHGGARHTDVLGAEGDVALDGGGDHAGTGLLEDQSDRAWPFAGDGSVDGHRPGALSGVRGLEQPGERTQQGGLA